MAVPKRRTSRTARKMRRANHDKVAAPALTRCSNCGEVQRPQRVGPSCGFYNGQAVIVKPAPASVPTEG